MLVLSRVLDCQIAVTGLPSSTALTHIQPGSMREVASSAQLSRVLVRDDT